MKTAPMPRISLHILTSLSEVSPEDWNQIAHGNPRIKSCENNRVSENPDSHSDGVDSKIQPPDSPHQADDSQSEDHFTSADLGENDTEEDWRNPFLSHAFLSSLEDAGCVGASTGWTPLHLVARDENGSLLGAIPTYAKSHSRGEYVFDHAFAQAYERAGGAYYPKLQISVPFTPATGRRVLVPNSPHEAAIRTALIAGLEGVRARIDASSIHATFLTAQDRDALLAAGFLLRQDQQFHFVNAGYADFEEFLSALTSRKRKVLKRERRDALAHGIEIECLTGSAIHAHHWDAFFEFYLDTGSRKWGSPYLNRHFFALIGARMPEDILLVMAKRDGRYIAGALNFIGANTLYGRNWGAIEHHPFLHFELCYYQAIDFAIARRLARVEAGAQGEHKLARGYVPVKTHSAHRFADPGFQNAVADYLVREREAVDETQRALLTMTPFRTP